MKKIIRIGVKKATRLHDTTCNYCERHCKKATRWLWRVEEQWHVYPTKEAAEIAARF